MCVGAQATPRAWKGWSSFDTWSAELADTPRLVLRQEHLNAYSDWVTGCVCRRTRADQNNHPRIRRMSPGAGEHYGDGAGAGADPVHTLG